VVERLLCKNKVLSSNPGKGGNKEGREEGEGREGGGKEGREVGREEGRRKRKKREGREGKRKGRRKEGVGKGRKKAAEGHAFSFLLLCGLHLHQVSWKVQTLVKGNVTASWAIRVPTDAGPPSSDATSDAQVCTQLLRGGASGSKWGTAG
jgi:hypothetical protein